MVMELGEEDLKSAIGRTKKIRLDEFKEAFHIVCEKESASKTVIQGAALPTMSDDTDGATTHAIRSSERIPNVVDENFSEKLCPELCNKIENAFETSSQQETRFDAFGMPLLTLWEIISVWQQITSAVAFCHGSDVIHTDLKLANFVYIMHADGSTTIKLIDFGCSRFVDETTRMHETGEFFGTMTHCAPEAFYKRYASKYQLTKAVDVYAERKLSTSMVFFRVC